MEASVEFYTRICCTKTCSFFKGKGALILIDCFRNYWMLAFFKTLIHWCAGLDFHTFSALWKTWLPFSAEALKSNWEVRENSKISVKIPIKIIPQNRFLFLMTKSCHRMAHTLKFNKLVCAFSIFEEIMHRTCIFFGFYAKHNST